MVPESIETLIDRARAADASLAMRQAAFGVIVERYQDAAYGLRHGAEVNASDRSGPTPLGRAERADRQEMATLLGLAGGVR